MSQPDIDPVTGALRVRLPDNVEIGEDCHLEWGDAFRRYCSTQERGLVIGDRVHVYTWTTFSIEATGRVEVGDDCVLVGALLMCAEHIAVGNRVVLSYNVTVADSDFHPRDPDLRRLDAMANAPVKPLHERPVVVSRPVEIGDGVWIGIGAIVLKGVTIGPGAVVGPGSVVTSDVAPGVTVAGNPATLVSRARGAGR